jgi:hypothetical protein
MRCRGGAPSTFGFQLYSTGETLLNVRFKPGTKPAGQGLNPGECSWLDRGMRAGEPAQLCQSVKDMFLSTSSTSVPGMEGIQLLVMTQWSKSAPWLEKIRNPAAYIDVYVYNDGRSCMVVTKTL